MIMKRIILAILFAGLITPCGVLAVNTHSITIKMSRCWKKSTEPSKAANHYGTFVFTNQCEPKKPPTTLKIAAGKLNPALVHPRKLRGVVEKIGRKFLPLAAEKALTIKPLKGPQVEGFYYTLTDKTPNPGEYHYMTQGAINLDGQILLLFTYLHHQNDSKRMKKVFSALENITLKTKSPRSEQTHESLNQA